MTSPLPCDPRQGTHYFRRTAGWPEPDDRCECGGCSYKSAKADQGVTLVISWDRKGDPIVSTELGPVVNATPSHGRP